MTCHRPQGSSVIDYHIVNEELLHRVNYFHVHELTYLSDHCMLSMQMKCNFIEQTATEMINLVPMPPKFHWSEDSPYYFQKALASDKVKHSLEQLNHSIHSKTLTSDDLAYELQNIFHLAARQSLKSSRVNRCPKQLDTNNPKKTRQRNKPWFDRSLQEIRERSINKGKLVSKYPYDPIIRGSYYKLQIEYNKLRKYKMRQFKQSLITQLDNLKENSPKEYWKLL